MPEAAHADVSRETAERLQAFVHEITAANALQNLVSKATLPGIWDRHIVDSLQLLPLAPATGPWLDVGTGAGFPGLVLALAGRQPMTLVEPRRLRAAFLSSMIERFGLTNVTVVSDKVERLTGSTFAVISARAVASLDRLFAGAAHLADDSTVWLLPKGRSARDELADARKTWQGAFELVPSRTDPSAAIVVARRVKHRAKR